MISLIGLDLAKKAGVAWYDDVKNQYYVTEIDGDIGTQYAFISSLIDDKPLILIEDFVYFASNRKGTAQNSTKTVKSLIKRIGVMEYLLKEKGCEVEMLNLNSVRARYVPGRIKKQKCLEYLQNISGLSLTTNHADALIMILYIQNILKDEKINLMVI